MNRNPAGKQAVQSRGLPFRRSPLHLRPPSLTVLLAAAVFVFTWLFRFNDPGGSFAGLTDDHFFYLVRGWQILFGDLPVRDFVDHGAPLFYYVGAAVQLLFGHGTLSELLFSVTVLAACAAATFWLANRAAGSVAAGLAGAAFAVFLEPRFYNYPKILVYVVAIAALWAFADRPGARTRLWLAAVTVVAFLFRHDHGAYVALSCATLFLCLGRLPLRARLRHAAVYAALVLVLVAPYLLFVQLNGGVGSYFRHAAAWADRDRDRAPVVWPGLFDNPDGVSEDTAQATGLRRAVAVVGDNKTAWLYYTEIALPFAALALLALSSSAFRPEWPYARAKLLTVAVLSAVLNAGFLRSPLEARLADPSVPHAILIAWMLAALVRLLANRQLLDGAWRRPILAAGARAAGVMIVLPIVAVFYICLTHALYDRLDSAGFVAGRWSKPVERARLIVDVIHPTWPLERWISPEAENPMRLAFYLRDCTTPTDRIFMQHYLPQVLALSQRAFAGGHADLRPGFFATDEAQQLTIERLRRQSVPVAIMATGEDYQNFLKSFPLIAAYFDRYYVSAGERDVDGRFMVHLLVQKAAVERRRYEPLDWPCFV